MKKIISVIAFVLSAAMLLTACDNTASTESSVGGNSSVVSSTESSKAQSDTESSKTQSDTESSEAQSDTESSEAQSDTESSEAQSGTESSEAQSDTENGDLTEEQIYENMIKRSLKSTGDTARMKKFFDKLENGEETTVAFIGGSITEGLTAGPELCWARLTYNYLCEQYPNTKINFVNAGMSGTPSVLGNVRLKRDVLDYNPDLVFVEFAVNDGMEQKYKDSYEALVRTVLSQPQQPAVALYFTVIKSGHTCEPHMSRVGEHYGLPMVSLNAVLKEEFDSGRMKWEDYSDDESHPNVWGHEMTRDLIVNMLEAVKAAIPDGNTEINAVPDSWVFGDGYYGMEFSDRTHAIDRLKVTSEGSYLTDRQTIAQFPDGWYFKGKTADFAPMELEFTGKTLMLIYKCANSKIHGTFVISVDGEKVCEIASNSPSGWNNPEIVQVYSGEEGTHKVTISLTNPEGDDVSTYAEILGFGVC